MQTNNILLMEVDVVRCLNPSTQYCMVNHPVYKVSQSNLYIIAFLKSVQSDIDKNCKSRVQFNTMLPQAVYILDVQDWFNMYLGYLQYMFRCTNV